MASGLKLGRKGAEEEAGYIMHRVFHFFFSFGGRGNAASMNNRFIGNGSGEIAGSQEEGELVLVMIRACCIPTVPASGSLRWPCIGWALYLCDPQSHMPTARQKRIRLCKI